MRPESKDTHQEAQGRPNLSPQRQRMHSAEQVEPEDLWRGQGSWQIPHGAAVSNPAYQTHAVPDGTGETSASTQAVGYGTSVAAVEAAAGPALENADIPTLSTVWNRVVQPSISTQKYAPSQTSKSLSSPNPCSISLEVRLQRGEAGG